MRCSRRRSCASASYTPSQATVEDVEADETTEAAPILQPRPPNKPRVVSSRPPQDPPPALLFSLPIPTAVDLPDEPSSPHAPVLDSFTFELAGSPKFKMEDAKDCTPAICWTTRFRRRTTTFLTTGIRTTSNDPRVSFESTRRCRRVACIPLHVSGDLLSLQR